MTEFGKTDCEICSHGRFTHSTLARGDGDDVSYARQDGRLIRGLRLWGNELRVNGDINIGTDEGMDGSLGSFHNGLAERVGIFGEDDGERNVHAVDAEVVFNHLGFDEVASVARIANGCERIGDKFGI